MNEGCLSARALEGVGKSQLPLRVDFYRLHINVQRFRGGLVFKAHGLLYPSTLGLRVITKKKKTAPQSGPTASCPLAQSGGGSLKADTGVPRS